MRYRFFAESGKSGTLRDCRRADEKILCGIIVSRRERVPYDKSSEPPARHLEIRE
jgi:hypothetical protein